MSTFSLGDIVQWTDSHGTHTGTVVVLEYNKQKCLIGWKNNYSPSHNFWTIDHGYFLSQCAKFLIIVDFISYITGYWADDGQLTLVSKARQWQLGNRVKVEGIDTEGMVIGMDVRPVYGNDLLVGFRTKIEHGASFVIDQKTINQLDHNLSTYWTEGIVCACWFQLHRISLVNDDNTIAQKSAGCFCRKCQNFSGYAEPNQADGLFVCWSCRTTPFYGSAVS